ncbi:immunity 53 family protein [Microbulbifer sp. JMSA008]|uniref:immunity 53 family protein n=1 Tax=Microbulbifer sp. JMSA008 TaxID=3243373 RepID=UPI004039D924
MLFVPATALPPPDLRFAAAADQGVKHQKHGKAIKELEEWYFSQCNEDWEHTYGIEIGTLDNPGWFLKVDITDTDIEEKEYEGFSYGVGDDAEASGNDWIIKKLEGGKFVGYGGAHKLSELIKLFLKWVKNA